MDYDDIMNRTWDDIPQPQLLPGGGWLIKGRNAGFMKAAEEGKSAKVIFFYTAKEPVTVGQDLLDEMGDYDFAINDLSYTIYIETAADWDKVRKHLEKHGVELSGKLFNDAGKLAFSKKFAGAEVTAEIGQRSYENNDGETIWQNTLSKFQKAE